jgi:hypothetical protein
LFSTSGGTASKLSNLFTAGADYPVMVRGVSNLTQIDENGSLRSAPTLDTGLHSFTPVIQGETTAGTNTYSVQFGRYRVDGQMVTAWFQVILSGNSVAMAGNLQVGGLPFTGYSSLTISGTGSLSRYNKVTLDAGYNQLGLTLQPGASAARVLESGSTKTPAAIQTTAIDGTAGYLEGVVQYIRN